MSTRIPYDPALFTLRRTTAVSSSLDEFLIGVSLLGATATTSTAIEAATVSITSGYTPDDNGTLLVEAETATIALSFWDEPGDILYPGDRIQVRYDSKLIFYGTVDGTEISYTVDPEATRYGAQRRVDFSATAAGVYAVMMGRIVTWRSLPKESAIHRIRRWVTVDDWD